MSKYWKPFHKQKVFVISVVIVLYSDDIISIQRANKRLGNPPQSNQELLMVKQGWKNSRSAWVSKYLLCCATVVWVTGNTSGL